MSNLDRFDELTATMRVVLYLYANPDSNISNIIKHSGAGQKASYSAKDFLEKKKLLKIRINPEFPNNPLYSLNEKGEQIAKYLLEIQKTLDSF